MSFNINEFRNALKGGGARPTLFQVTFSFPTGLGVGGGVVRQASFTAKSAMIPGSNLGVIEVPYFGRTIKEPGDRTFEDWTATLIVDEDFATRAAFEKWHDAMARISGNTNSLRPTIGQNYRANVKIEQFGKAGQVVKTYELKNAWPSNVAQIALSWESRDSIEEFDVTFAYDYFTIDGRDIV